MAGIDHQKAPVMVREERMNLCETISGAPSKVVAKFCYGFREEMEKEQWRPCLLGMLSCVEMRKMMRETRMVKASLIYPMFVTEGKGIRREIPSMPGSTITVWSCFCSDFIYYAKELAKFMDEGRIG